MASKKTSNRSRKVSVKTRDYPRKVYAVFCEYHGRVYATNHAYTSRHSALVYALKSVRRSLRDPLVGLVPLRLQALDQRCQDWLRGKSTEAHALRIVQDYVQLTQGPTYKITSYLIRN